MKLRRVEIAGFRKLAGPVVLDGLGDGLVLISGQNEEGKSTVLAALKAAFFEHHAVGGAVREAMAPHGGGVPEVAVTFDHAGRTYRLRKAFRRGGVELECDGRRCGDDAAERLLQELLRFERRTAREPKPENAGLQALFWVDQATTFRGFDALAGGRDRIAAAVAGEVGAVVGGERARRLLVLARERAESYFTPGRQTERGELKAAGERLRLLVAEQERLTARRRDHEGRVDRLARLRDERRRFMAQDELGRARQRLQSIDRRLSDFADVERRAALAGESLKAAAAEQARHDAARNARRDLIDEVERLAAAERELARRAAAAAGELEAAQQVTAAARVADRDAAAAALAAAGASAALRDRQALARLRAEAQQLEEARARADTIQAAAARARTVTQATPATPEILKKIQACVARCHEATARVEAAATSVELQPDGARQARRGGQVLAAGVSLRLAERTVLELEGFGRIVVVPGGDELVPRQTRLREAESALAETLAAAGVASPAEAEAAVERRRQAEEELRRHEAEARSLLQTLGLRSLEALAARAFACRAEVERLESGLDEGARALAGEDLADEARRAEAAFEEAQERQRQRRADLQAAEARLAAAGAAHGGLEGERKAAVRQVEDGYQRLALAREQATDDELMAAARMAAERRHRAEEADQALQRDLRSADLESLRERQVLAERALADLEVERQRLDREVRDLEVALREAGAEGWGERLTELEGEVAAAAAEHARLERQGKAWRLLHERLQAADQAARDALLAPVVTRLRPLLQRVFPGAEPIFDPQHLALTHLSRDGVAERFESLSVGAREQVAVLVRLAFAQLLRDREGEASCLILDDALVYADEERFDTMKTILQRAAADLQIVVLTCRPRDYSGLDVRHLRLEDCRPR